MYYEVALSLKCDKLVAQLMLFDNNPSEGKNHEIVSHCHILMSSTIGGCPWTLYS